MSAFNIDRPDWFDDAACRSLNPRVFFPSPGRGTDIKIALAEAARVCDGCPVIETCLAYALEHRIPHGMWGGKNERERRRLLKGLRAVPDDSGVAA